MEPRINLGYYPEKGVTRELLTKYDLGLEVLLQQPRIEQAAAEVADLVYSVHVHWLQADIGRYNFAAIDPEFRQLSLDIMEASLAEGATHFPQAQVAVIHGAPARWAGHPHPGGDGGDYDLFIAGLRELADYAHDQGLRLVLENNNSYWVDRTGKFGWQDARPSIDMRYFGCGPEDWLKAYDDAAHDNLKLCLDTAHAFTWAHHIADHDKRIEAVLTYFQRPEAIAHVHWNGHEAFEPDGRVDGHLNVGKDTIPTQIHRNVKALGVPVILEHYYGEEALVEELAYIKSL
ncbi:MAG: TIM barrel protein [candidate division WS1 bacterium]|nr:TIM barrel protein [candidate division WS1 bacterium]